MLYIQHVSDSWRVWHGCFDGVEQLLHPKKTQWKQNSQIWCFFAMIGWSSLWITSNMLISQTNMYKWLAKNMTGWWFQPLWKILVNGKDSPIYLQTIKNRSRKYIYRWIQLQCTTIPFLALGGQILFWTLPNDTPIKPQGPLLRVHINDILRAHLWSFPIKYIIIPMPELWNHRVHSHVASCRHWCQKRMRMTRILSPAQMASLGPRTAHKSSPIGSMVLVRGGAP